MTCLLFFSIFCKNRVHFFSIFIGSQQIPFSILGSDVKQRTDSPCTSLKHPQRTPGRPVNRAGNISNKKNSEERATFSRNVQPQQ